MEITGNDFVYNLAPSDDPFLAKLFKIDIGKIDRHILMKEFKVVASYMFLDDVDMKLYRTEYSFEVEKLELCYAINFYLKSSQVPSFQRETRLQFKFLGHYHADRRITSLYNYKFKEHGEMSSDELELLHEIE